MDVLLDAVQPLGDVQLYCPDLAAYRYVIAATNAVVFGFAVGMSTVSFRFDERMTARRCKREARPFPSAETSGWQSFTIGRMPPGPPWTSGSGARHAYMYARTRRL